MRREMLATLFYALSQTLALLGTLPPFWKQNHQFIVNHMDFNQLLSECVKENVANTSLDAYAPLLLKFL